MFIYSILLRYSSTLKVILDWTTKTDLIPMLYTAINLRKTTLHTFTHSLNTDDHIF